ncbi:MAG: hypothetical protein R3E32_28145 [Chitinophagales bacterium]
MQKTEPKLGEVKRKRKISKKPKELSRGMSVFTPYNKKTKWSFEPCSPIFHFAIMKIGLKIC